MNAAVRALVVALKVAEFNEENSYEPYPGYKFENARTVEELKEGLTKLKEGITEPCQTTKQ